MSNGIVIIGSGFAARQLVKNIRKQDASIPLTLIAADSMDEYNKPDLSHVISQGQRADDLTRQTAGEFAEQFNLLLFPQTWVTDIDAEARVVKSQNNQWQYDKLIVASNPGDIEKRVAFFHGIGTAAITAFRNVPILTVIDDASVFHLYRLLSYWLHWLDLRLLRCRRRPHFRRRRNQHTRIGMCRRIAINGADRCRWI